MFRGPEVGLTGPLPVRPGGESKVVQHQLFQLNPSFAAGDFFWEPFPPGIGTQFWPK